MEKKKRNRALHINTTSKTDLNWNKRFLKAETEGRDYNYVQTKSSKY